MKKNVTDQGCDVDPIYNEYQKKRQEKEKVAGVILTILLTKC